MSRTELKKREKTSKNMQTIQVGEREMFETDDENMRRPILMKKNYWEAKHKPLHLVYFFST